MSVTAQTFTAPDKYIVNHDIMHCTADGVVGNHLYSGRALGITEPWDILQLTSELKPSWQAITKHYERIGLSHTRDVIWDVSMDHLGQYIGYHPSVFFFGPQQYLRWGDNDWVSIVDFINSKNNFMTVADQLGVKVPLTIGFDSVAAITEQDIARMPFPCYLKAAVSVSGVGIYRCADRDELDAAMASFEPGVPVQLQEEVIARSFLNMQYRIDNGFAIRLACTEQILDGTVHQGNRFPACCEPWDVVEPMALWLAERGIKGIFAFDVAVIDKPDGVSFAAIECNPRYNGATYPTLIANKMGIRQWSARYYKTHYRSLDDIFIDHIEYSRKIGRGVIIVNWGTITEGKLMVLLAGNEEQQRYLDAELRACL